MVLLELSPLLNESLLVPSNGRESVLVIDDEDDMYLYHDDIDLEAKMVVTIEPGISVPKVGGVTIEDIVLVTGGGSRLLTSAGRGLD